MRITGAIREWIPLAGFLQVYQGGYPFVDPHLWLPAGEGLELRHVGEQV
ncbi:MAG: hypothetical protein RLZZ165_252, partial [Bacteroidota bacterium]